MEDLSKKERTSEEIKELHRMAQFQLGKENISFRYKDKGMVTLMYCDSFLKPGYEMPGTEE